ncbi:PREDICTED: uncharacterized protein LOC104810213 [Tarenaya hassleriana]|uniref:uncharacterized protein LOC104810213 n=1 Tax=Tarenaya hassleriana TaxID=28532 RepID=UPI00053C6330|nr:PREDICTED: uncharacterized protein LOC104810213 [Tarenaya hassleriana]
MALEGRNKMGFVTGDVPRPDDGDPDAQLWYRNNVVVSSWLINSVSPTIAPSLLYHSTAREIWLNLVRRFKQSNTSRLYGIKQQLHSLRQGSLDVTTFYTKLLTIWEEIKALKPVPHCKCGNCSCNISQDWRVQSERDFVIDFLFGLNDSYDAIRSQIIMLDPLPDLEKTFHLITQHEQQRSIKTPVISDLPVLQASVSVDLPPRPVAAISGSGFRGKTRPLCTHCGLHGHTVAKCYRLHGFPQGYRSSSPVAVRPSNSSALRGGGTQRFSSFSGKHAVNTVSCDDQPHPVPDVNSMTVAQIHHLYSQITEKMNLDSRPSITGRGAPDTSNSGHHSRFNDWHC